MGTLLIITIWKREKLRTIAESIRRSLNENFVFGLPPGKPVGKGNQHLPIFSSILLKGKGKKERENE